MNFYTQQITRIEHNRRIALTSRYPFLLPFILESRRMLRTLHYTFHPKFKTHQSDTSSWYHLTEHSSPLYRKYNKRELDEGKIENINLAIQHLNNIVIPPGKVFSFWKHVGRSSAKRGFKQGLLLSNGRLKEGVGGGLCQLSNLIAYMFACTECVFIERKHHSKDVFPDSGRTVPFASGATVFFNLIDVQIKNTYPFPIRITLRTTDTQLRGSIDAPVPLNHVVKLEEHDSQFITSADTQKLYRCNTLHRVFYTKHTKTHIKEEPLWTNIAEVMYDKSHIHGSDTPPSPTL
jgi:vancomycin resistance protein VanW